MPTSSLDCLRDILPPSEIAEPERQVVSDVRQIGRGAGPMVRRLALLYRLCSLFVLGVFIVFGFREAEIGALIGALVVAYGRVHRWLRAEKVNRGVLRNL